MAATTSGISTTIIASVNAAKTGVLIPLVVAAIAFTLAPTELALGSVGYATLSGGVGVGLYRRAGARWERKALAEGD